MKRILSLLTAGALLVFSTGNVVFADDTNKYDVGTEALETYENTGYLVEEKTTVLDDGTLIVEKLYCDTDLELLSVDQPSSGSRPIKYEKCISSGEGDKQILMATVWVSGDFSWNNTKNTATVSNVKSGQTFYNGSSYVDSDIEYKSNQGSNVGWGRIYAYAKYTLKFSTGYNNNHECSVYIDCNVNGVSTYA